MGNLEESGDAHSCLQQKEIYQGSCCPSSYMKVTLGFHELITFHKRFGIKEKDYMLMAQEKRDLEFSYPASINIIEFCTEICILCNPSGYKDPHGKEICAMLFNRAHNGHFTHLPTYPGPTNCNFRSK